MQMLNIATLKADGERVISADNGLVFASPDLQATAFAAFRLIIVAVVFLQKQFDVTVKGQHAGTAHTGAESDVRDGCAVLTVDGDGDRGICVNGFG